MKETFRKFSRVVAHAVGSGWAFALAIAVVVVWFATGPIFQYSDTWQLIINTGTTIVTFLMVFLIQNTQNRDTVAVHLKLDELIRSIKSARNRLIDLEEMTDDEIHNLQKEFEGLCKKRGHDHGPSRVSFQQHAGAKHLPSTNS
jgi:low affinity Fe/Cu permease